MIILLNYKMNFVENQLIIIIYVINKYEKIYIGDQKKHTVILLFNTLHFPV